MPQDDNYQEGEDSFQYQHQSEPQSSSLKRKREPSEDQENSHGRSHSEHHEPEAKRPKTVSQPSKVLHFSNLPPNVTTEAIQQEIDTSTYGIVTVLIINNNQAFVQFNDIEAATQFLEDRNHQLDLQGNMVRLSYSHRDNLDRDAKQELPPNHILHITFVNARYLVNVNQIKQTFEPFGDVQKIQSYTKNNRNQALIQFADLNQAVSAKAKLDGQNLPHTRNIIMRIHFSTTSDVTIKFNSERSYDASLPPPMMMGGGPPPMGGPGPMGYSAPPFNDQYGMHPYPPMPMDYGPPQDPYGGPRGMPPNPYMGGPPMGFGPPPMGPPPKLMIVSNIPRETGAEDLFTLFGVWGDVVAVKFLLKSEGDTIKAFVEFNTPDQLMIALDCLQQGLPFRGKRLRVDRAHSPFLEPPRGGNTTGYYEFFNSKDHRFKNRPNTHPTPPSNLLHFYNISVDTTEEDLQQYIRELAECEVSEVRFLSSKVHTTKTGESIEKKTANIKCQSIDDAVNVLVKCHGKHPLRNLTPRITFSDQTPRR